MKGHNNAIGVLACTIALILSLLVLSTGCAPAPMPTIASTATETSAIYTPLPSSPTPPPSSTASAVAALSPTIPPTPTTKPVSADATRRALWVWNTDVVTDEEARAKFFDFLRAKNINAVFLYAYNLLPREAEALERFIVEADDVQVELLAGDPSFALSDNHPEVLTFVQESAEFSERFTDQRKPYAIHLDIEPYLLDRWSTDQAQTITQYLNLLKQVKDKLSAAESSMLLAVDIPFWFDTVEATYGNETKPLNQQVQDIVDYVVLMDYRDIVTSDDGLISHAQEELLYGLEIEKPVTIGVETQCGELDKVTFCEEGESALDQALSESQSLFEKNRSFNGFAIHHYLSYVSLSEAPPSYACTRLSAGQRPPSTVLGQVSYKLNDNSPLLININDEGSIDVQPDDVLSLTNLTYCSDTDGAEGEEVALEVYVRKNGDFDFNDGRFDQGTSIAGGEHPLQGFDDAWTIEPGWDGLMLVLVHHYPDGKEVDDRFYINLVQPPPTEERSVSTGEHAPHTVISQVSYSLNGSTPQTIGNEGTINIQPGDVLSLTNLYYRSVTDGGPQDAVAVEVYVRKNGKFDYTDGRFDEGVPIATGEQPLQPIDGSWTIQSGWDRLIVSLVHYYPDGNEIDDRFFINLVQLVSNKELLKAKEPVATEECRRLSFGQHPPNAVISQAKYSVNGGMPQTVEDEGVVIVEIGDTITVTDLHYCSDGEEVRDALAVEIYIRKGDEFDYTDGRFGSGVPILRGDHPLTTPSEGWTTQRGRDRLVIALVHYYNDSYEVDDRFFVNLVTK